MNNVPSDLAVRLAQLDSSVVSDALDALGMAGTPLGIRAMWEGARVAGPVVTVELTTDPPNATDEPVHLGARAIEAGQPGDVIVVANEGRTEMGAWGGLLAQAARQRGIAGVVIHGAVRDVDEARDLGFPVFACAPINRTARGRTRERQTGRAVKIGDVTVRTGDLVVADGSGVAFIAGAEAESVVEKAEELATRERSMLASLRRGVSPSEVLGASYEHMLAADKQRE